MTTDSQSTPGSLAKTVDLVEDSFSHLLTVSFAKTRSAHYPLVVNLAEGAAKYEVRDIGSIPVHFVAFSKEKEDATRAMLVLGYTQEWKTLQIFGNGRLLRHASRVLDILHCYLEALSCDDYRAHCFRTIDDPFSEKQQGLVMRITIPLQSLPEEEPEPKPDRYIFPCLKLSPDVAFQRGHPAAVVDLLQAASVKHLCDWCPNFDPNNFKKLEDDAPDTVS